MSASESRSAVVLQLAEEFLERYRQGQRPSLKEYIDRHPQLAAEIKEVFPAMALMENVALADESLAGEATGPATPAESAPPQQLGDYRILREVGRGGMGIVYEAEQVSLGRHVALKVLPRQLFVDDQQRRRFEREAKAAAKLHHTNIVPVFGVGEHDGLPYYVMQFIQGLGLDDVLDELKRMGGSGTPTPGGELRVARKDISAADVARSLLTGEFPEGERGASAPCFSPQQGADAPRSPESSASGKLSDSFTLSSSVTLPAARLKGKKASYWQSVSQIGVQVAEALEYAHKQGIQHRDIKPSNLLLDTRGTVWITDFGLARADNEDHLTQTGDIVGTLRYMPPEAFEGHADKRGDIYSLGLTLYELLALKPAYEERDRRRLIKRVTSEEPAPLDKLSRSIPRDLVTIIHKAIDREPARRYQTAGELAADLQRFFDDEPIQARRISNSERFLRWCRHHPGVATLTAALAVILVTVTVVSLIAAARFDRAALREQQARRAAEEAKEHERELRQQAEEATEQAESSLREAEQQKQRAEANFAKARKAVDDYFTTVSESQLLKVPVPGMQPLRRDLLQSALSFYQDFLKERGEDATLRGELAATYLRVGRIRSELEEGSEARKAYEQGQTLYEELTKVLPASVEWRHGLAQCYFWNGRIDEAIALWEKLVQPEQPRFQKELAHAYRTRALHLWYNGELAKGLQDHQRALAIRERLVRLDPQDVEAQRDLGGTLSHIGELLVEKGKGRTTEALAMYRRGAGHAEAAFAQAPQVVMNGRFLAYQLKNVAYLERQLGHVKEALEALRRIADVWRKLAQDNPAVPGLHSNLWGTYRILAMYQQELKQNEEAERTLRLAREVIDRLPSDGPEALFKLACVRAECAAILGQGKAKPTVEEKAEQKREANLAMETLRKAVAAGFRDADRLRNSAELNGLRGRIDFRVLQKFLDAWLVAASPGKTKSGQQDAAQRHKASQADPRNRRLRADMAASRRALALIQLDLGNLEESQKQLHEAIALGESLVKDEPTNAQYLEDLMTSRFVLGDFYWRSGRLGEGAKVWQQGLDDLEAAAPKAPDRSPLTDRLLDMRGTAARHFAQAGLWSEAHTHYGRLIQLPGASEYDYFCACCLALLVGDAAAYRHDCEAMVKRFGERRDHDSLAWLAWGCVLSDGAGIDPSAAIKRASMMRPPVHRSGELWQDHILGLSHYRAGQFSEAVAQASKSSGTNSTWASRILNWPVLALAHHRLGHAEEARRWLERANEEWRRLSPLVRSPGSSTVLPSKPETWHEVWHDWLVFEILLREASLAITGSAAVEQAYDHAHRSLLYGRLGDAAKAETEWQAALKMLPHEPMIWLSRAHYFSEQKRHKAAEDVLAKIEAFGAKDPEVWTECGRLRFALHQTSKAAAHFRKAVELLGDKAEVSETAASGADQLFAQVADKAFLQRLTAAVEHNPADASLRWERGNWYARHRRWKEAAADLRIALERNPPDDTHPWLHVMPVLVAADDRPGYFQLRSAMRKRFGELQDPTTAERLAKGYLLLADGVVDAEWAGQMADRAVTLGKDHDYADYFAFCKVLADYRRGRYQAIIKDHPAFTSMSNYRPELIAGWHSILAMALHRQEDVQGARAHLAQAAKLLDRYLSDPDRFPTFSDSSYHHDWLIAWLLHREAQTLIEGKKAEPQK